MRLGFYPRLAARSIRLNGRFYVPYLLSGAMAAAMFYDILFLNMNSGQPLMGYRTLSTLLGMGAFVVAVFSLLLLFYTNSFLMKRRQQELGLYHMLGMEKRHMGRLLFCETVYTALICTLGGLVIGVLLSKLFLLLLARLIGDQVPFGFEVPGEAVAYTLVVFLAIYAVSCLYNLLRLRRIRAVELLKGTATGEKEPRTRWLLTLIGVLTLGGGYGLSLLSPNPETDMDAFLFGFFVAVLLVIAGTYCLFIAGSIALLKALRRNKRYYYQTRHFVSVSGMLHRMKRNGAGLATICILSTMVLVTLSVTFGLYAGVDRMNQVFYPRDLQTFVHGTKADTLPKVEAIYAAVLKEQGATPRNMAGLGCYCAMDAEVMRSAVDESLRQGGNGRITGDESKGELLIYVGCDVEESADTQALYYALEDAVLELTGQEGFVYQWTITEDGRSDRGELLRNLGGTFFIGLFLGSLFLMAAVLIIYYKQLSEGYEDARSFAIMQQVGMTRQEVKQSIRSQVSLVFFLPLLAAACHTLAAAPMTGRLLSLFAFGSWTPFLLSSLITLLIFALVYYGIYRLTAREYYRIVKR